MGGVVVVGDARIGNFLTLTQQSYHLKNPRESHGFHVELGKPLRWIRSPRVNAVGLFQEGGSAAVADDGSGTAAEPRGEDLGEADDSIVDAKESAEREVTSDATSKSATGGSLHERW